MKIGLLACAFVALGLFAKADTSSVSRYSDVRGFNFQPPWGSNGRDIWLERFDPVEYRHIIRSAKKAFPRLNTLRVWLSFDAWYENRMMSVTNASTAAKIIAEEHLKMIPVYFNGWHAIPDFGGITIEQLGFAAAKDWEPYGRYLRETVAAIESTGAVLMADLCNEPLTLTQWTESATRRVCDFLKAMAAQHRKVSAAPVTIGSQGFWFWDGPICGAASDLDLFAGIVDVFSVHPYSVAMTPKADHLKWLKRLVAKADELHRPILATECCWDDGDDKARGEVAKLELGNCRQVGIGFVVHALTPSPVADLHPKDGVNPGLYMPFMNLDGTIRPFHECFNDLPSAPSRRESVGTAAGSASPGLDPIVPFAYRACGVTNGIAELRRIRATTGLRRFLLIGPGFNDVMYRPFPADLYSRLGEDLAAFKKGLADTDIELGWWLSPSIRYVSDFPPVEDARGNRSVDNKKCPLDPAFASDFAGKVCAIARHHPAFINIEDDFTLAWGRGLGDTGACFCPRHLAAFARRYGKSLTAREIESAFRNQTEENRTVRQAFADVVRESLVELAKRVRSAVDRIDPSIRIMLCQPGGCDKDGDSTEALARAFAGGTRPCVRPFGAIYGAETTPADIPVAVSHAILTLERLPKDIETFYEADTYPHNRFYSSASQLLSLMTGAMAAGSDDFLFYCLQYLDDPIEDPGYFRLYADYRPRLERLRDFIRERRARLVGVREVWTADDLALTRGLGDGHGMGTLGWQSYFLAKFGIPYTTRSEADGPALLAAGTADVLSDGEIRRLLSGGVLMDAPAAAILTRRGFGAQLGVDVREVERIPALGERILPEAGCTRPGKRMNAFFRLSAGSEGTVERFARLTPRPGTEVLSQFTGLDEEPLAPSVTFAENELGGRVAVMATSLVNNRTSALYNLRKQELMQRLFVRLSDGALPVVALDTPGVWLLANVSEDGREMLLTVDNLSGDDRDGLRFRVASCWRGTAVSRVADDGSEEPMGNVDGETWCVRRKFTSMRPEFFLLRKVETDADLVVYGSSPAALTAAIEAKAQGLTAVIVSPERRIGGLTTGGLGQTDIGHKEAFGGLALRFYRDIAAHYADPAHWTQEKRSDYQPDGQCSGTQDSRAMWTFEPSAALAVLEEWVRRHQLDVCRGELLDRGAGGVEKRDGRIVAFRTLSGHVYRGKVFVDATYEGDLMAAAGVSYAVGREDNSVYRETLNGAQPTQGAHHFLHGVSPYVRPDDPASGLLPGIEATPMEPTGTGDRRVQAYCFRMCLTDAPDNRIPFSKPGGYDERDYELLLRNLEALMRPENAEARNDWCHGLPWINSRMPNRKTDTNNRTGVSTDFIGQNYRWPEASYEEREMILKRHLAYQQGLMWTLANHPRVPEFVRREVSRWGTCRDEFADGLGNGWQRQLYVREARRLVGESVMTERHCRGTEKAARPIAMAAYQMDSHHVRRYVGEDGFVHNEGDVEVGGGKPYPIDYGAIVPKRDECSNLLVPVCVSASHIAFGSIRMEPVFFALGQAAGAAAAQAVEQGSAVQDVDYKGLSERLKASGQVF